MASPVADRFWGLTSVGTVPVFAPHLGSCLLWTGSVGTKGYGRFSPARGQHWLSHRWSYVHTVGPIPPDRPQLDHLCRVLLCVRPQHLEPVTRAENLRREHVARRAS